MSMHDIETDLNGDPLTVETNIRLIKWYTARLYRFCEGDGPPKPGFDERLAKLLQGQRKGIVAAVKKQTVGFGWLFICNLTLLALILWRVW